MSILPWRRAGVKYAQHEVFFDIVEEVDMILDRSVSPLCFIRFRFES